MLELGHIWNSLLEILLINRPRCLASWTPVYDVQFLMIGVDFELNFILFIFLLQCAERIYLLYISRMFVLIVKRIPYFAPILKFFQMWVQSKPVLCKWLKLAVGFARIKIVDEGIILSEWTPDLFILILEADE